MESSRLPRFKRATTVAPVQLTERDRDIIRLVSQHRFLRSSHIVSLLGASSQQVLRRLKLLYHHGYLERPRAQLQYYERGGSKSIAYGLGKKGGAVVQQDHGIAVNPDAWGEKNHGIGRIFLEHALLVSDVMVAIELACRHQGVRLLTEQELGLALDPSGRRQLFRWKVKVNPTLRLGVVPDRVFALEFNEPNGNLNRTLFFLEADRGTMPVIRSNLAQTSFYRKLLAYEATWLQSVHRRRFGFNRFRVLTVTTSATRVKSLVDACSKLKSGRGLFLFAGKTILERPDDMLAAHWQMCRGNRLTSLLD